MRRKHSSSSFFLLLLRHICQPTSKVGEKVLNFHSLIIIIIIQLICLPFNQQKNIRPQKQLKNMDTSWDDLESWLSVYMVKLITRAVNRLGPMKKIIFDYGTIRYTYLKWIVIIIIYLIIISIICLSIQVDSRVITNQWFYHEIIELEAQTVQHLTIS